MEVTCFSLWIRFRTIKAKFDIDIHASGIELSLQTSCIGMYVNAGLEMHKVHANTNDLKSFLDLIK